MEEGSGTNVAVPAETLTKGEVQRGYTALGELSNIGRSQKTGEEVRPDHLRGRGTAKYRQRRLRATLKPVVEAIEGQLEGEYEAAREGAGIDLAAYRKAEREILAEAVDEMPEFTPLKASEIGVKRIVGEIPGDLIERLGPFLVDDLTAEDYSREDD